MILLQVKSKLGIISSYADATEGLITHGWITKIEVHGCFVRFYNGVQGFAPRQVSYLSVLQIQNFWCLCHDHSQLCFVVCLSHIWSINNGNFVFISSPHLSKKKKRKKTFLHLLLSTNLFEMYLPFTCRSLTIGLSKFRNYFFFP